MKTSLILPAILLGAASLGLSASAFAYTQTTVNRTYSSEGLLSVPGAVLTGTANVVGGVVDGTANTVGYVVGSPRYFTHTTTVNPDTRVRTYR